MQWDTYRMSIVGQYDGVNLVNSFFYQETVVGNQGEGPIRALFDASLDMREAFLEFLNIDYQATCVTIRRLAPGMTEVVSFPFTGTGGLNFAGLAATNFGLLRYWTKPHSSRSRNSIRIGALSEILQQGGQFTNSTYTALNTFLSQWVGTDLISDGYTFRPIRSRKPDDIILQPLPRVDRAELDPRVRNDRSRTPYQCTG